MTAHADTLLSMAPPPGYALIRDTELSALVTVLTTARATVAAAGDDCPMPALEAALDAVPPTLATGRARATGVVRRAPDGAYLVASASAPGTVHRVTVDGAGLWACDCRGYAHRRDCRHCIEVSEYNRGLAPHAVWEDHNER